MILILLVMLIGRLRWVFSGQRNGFWGDWPLLARGNAPLTCGWTGRGFQKFGYCRLSAPVNSWLL